MMTAATLLVSSAGLSISLAALLFPDPLDDGLARATSAFLVGNGLAIIFYALRGALGPVVSVSQGGPAVVLVAVVAQMVTAGNGFGAIDVLVFIALTTTLAALAMLMVARYRLAAMVRFLPTVVIAGFVAGTGWLLFKGGLDVATGEALGLGNATAVIEDGRLALLAPALVLGVAVLACGVSSRVPDWTIGVTVLTGVVVFYLIALPGSSLAEVEGRGWLIGPFRSGSQFGLVTPSEVADAPWGLFGANGGGLLTVAAVATVGLLLNLSGLEAITGRRVDLDQEVRNAGLINLVQGPLGAIPTYHGLGSTVLALRMGVAGRSVIVVVGAVSLGLGLLGATAVGYVPRFVAGGVLVAAGAGLLLDWVRQLRTGGGWADRILSIGIVGVIATIGIIEGIVLGIVVASALFIVRYSRVDPVRRLLRGTAGRSRVDRTLAELEILDSGGEQVRIFELQGYLFFGSMIGVTEQVRMGCEDDAVRHLVLDFRHVTGIDASALEQLDRLLLDLNLEGQVMFSGIDASMAARLGRLTEAVEHRLSLDEAVAEIEDTLLAEGEVPTPGLASSDSHTDSVGRPPIEELPGFTMSTIPPGSVIVRAGESSDTLIRVISGTVSAHSGDPSQTRFRQSRGPTWVGEIGFLRGSVRSADVISDTEVELATIDRETFDDLWRRSPESVLVMLDDIARVQSDRIATISAALADALD